jgi:predicted nucleic acid-binding protein
VNLRRLRAFLHRHRRLGVDTSAFIYHLEANPTYLPLTERLFAWIAREHGQAVTSTLTMTELLVLPYRSERPDAAASIFAAAVQMPNIEWISPSLGIAGLAARARALYRLRTLDAIQLATTIDGGADGFVTNDADFRRVRDVEVLILDDLL